MKALLTGLLLFALTISNSQDFKGLKKINGTQLYVSMEGKGTPILFIHGGPGLNHSYFLPHLDPLSKKYKSVFYDQRACGQSMIPSADSLRLAFFITDVEALREELKVDKITILPIPGAHFWLWVMQHNFLTMLSQ